MEKLLMFMLCQIFA